MECASSREIDQEREVVAAAEVESVGGTARAKQNSGVEEAAHWGPKVDDIRAN